VSCAGSFPIHPAVLLSHIISSSISTMLSVYSVHLPLYAFFIFRRGGADICPSWIFENIKIEKRHIY
jgi:hypothetical protein